MLIMHFYLLHNSLYHAAFLFASVIILYLQKNIYKHIFLEMCLYMFIKTIQRERDYSASLYAIFQNSFRQLLSNISWSAISMPILALGKVRPP